MIFDNASDPLTSHGEQHDSPIRNGGLRVAGVDWDKPRACNISLPGEPIFKLPPDEFIEWYRSGAGDADVVCFERPHLRARGEFSRAQVWTATELERLVGGPPILMPNGKKLHKMAAFAGNVVDVTIAGVRKKVPDKAKDSDSIRRYAEAHPNIMLGWKRFVPPSEDTTPSTHGHRDALRAEIGQTINEWRELWQDVKGKDATRALPFVQNAAAILDAAFSDLSDDCKAVFKLTRSKGTVNLTTGRTRVMTVYAMARDRDGNVRTHNGAPLGRRYLMKDVVGMCDSYMPNMARANLTGYAKNGIADAPNRTKLNRAVKELLRVFQADPLIYDGERPNGADSLTADGGQPVHSTCSQTMAGSTGSPTTAGEPDPLTPDGERPNGADSLTINGGQESSTGRNS